jgi:hypothetical protein
MVHTVLPALIPDIRKIYDAYFASFDNERMGNIMLKIIFPDGVESEEFRAAHAAGTLDWWGKSDTQYTYKCVDMDTGDIVGMGLVDIYIKPRTEEERKNGGVPWLTGEHQERAEKVLNPLWEAREKLFGGQPYICELHPKITAVLFDAVTDSKYFQIFYYYYFVFLFFFFFTPLLRIITIVFFFFFFFYYFFFIRIF